MAHVMESNLPLFSKTPPFKLFHEFIVGNHPILMEENLIKISREFKVVVFPIFSYIYVVEYNKTISKDQTKEYPPFTSMVNHHICIVC